MKKLFFVLLVFVIAVCATCVLSVKAEELETVIEETITEDKKEEKEEIVKVVETETKKETVEVKEESTEEKEVVVEEETSNEKNSEYKTTKKVKLAEETDLDSDVEDRIHDNTNNKHRTCIYFIDTSVNPSYNVSSSSCVGEGTGGSKSSNKLKVTRFEYNDSIYEFDGWYDEEGNPVTTFVTAGDPTRIKISYKASKEKCVEFKYYLRWKKVANPPIYYYNQFDYISNGSKSSNNTGGHTGDYTNTFFEPVAVSHYQFLYYKIEDAIYNPGETYTIVLDELKEDTVTTINAYAYWKADITLSLYDGKTSLGSKSQFDSISISDIISEEPVKDGYKFVGWVDENGNEVSETSFEAEEPGTKPTPREVKLYAKWNKLVKVTKKWNDNNNNDSIRPDKVTVYVKKGNEKIANKELSENNNWTYTFEISDFDENESDSYDVMEDEVEGYNPTITGDVFDGFIIENIHEDYKYEKVTVKKEWEDKDNMNNSRPNSVTVHLNIGEEEVASIELNEENNWEASFENITKLKDGETIEYSILEDEVEGYEQLSLVGDMENGFVITNEFVLGEGGTTQEDEEEETNVTDNPQTGDDIVNSIAMLLVSLFGFVSGLVYLKKNN